MNTLVRNQLLCVDSVGWALIEAHEWDEQARTIFSHWRTHQLPLVVCRQGAETPPDIVCMGLPSPQQWSRRRMALTVSPEHLTAHADFPSLAQVVQANQWGAAAIELSDAIARLDVNAHVYGSHGWQWLTGLAYLHEASDLDLSLTVNSWDMASQLVQRLANTSIHCRVDGEIVFPQGKAVAWRELYQLIQGKTSQVLMKDRHSLKLLTLKELIHLCSEASAQSSKIEGYLP